MSHQGDLAALIDGCLNRWDVYVWVAGTDHHDGLRRDGPSRSGDGHCDNCCYANASHVPSYRSPHQGAASKGLPRLNAGAFEFGSAVLPLIEVKRNRGKKCKPRFQESVSGGGGAVGETAQCRLPLLL